MTQKWLIYYTYRRTPKHEPPNATYDCHMFPATAYMCQGHRMERSMLYYGT